MDFGGFFIFNALCEMVDKLTSADQHSLATPIPPYIKVAGIVVGVCAISTTIIIATIL